MIKHYFKQLLITIILVLSSVSLSACHGGGKLTAYQAPEEFDVNTNYELTFWAKNDTNLTQVAIYNKAVADFQELYPNITINIRFYTDYSRLYNDVITNISTQTTPNVCITYPDHIATYMSGENVVVSLDNLFSDEKYGLGGSELRFDGPSYEEIVPKFLEECKLENFYYAVPFMRSTEACYVNKTYIEKLGYTLPETLTWDFIFEVSEAAMAKNEDGTFKINGQNILIPFIYKSTDNMMIQYLKQTDAGYSDETGNIEIFNDTTRDFLKVITKEASVGAFSTFQISSYPANFLNAGQCIFAIDSTAGATWMGSEAPLVDIPESSLVKFETKVMTIPQVDVNNPTMISQGPSICIFNKEDPNEVLASWLFTQYLLTNEVQNAYAETEGYIPVTSKAHNSTDYQEYLRLSGTDGNMHYSIKIDATKLLLDNISNTFVTPVFNGSASLREASGSMIEAVTKSVRRKQTVDDAFIDKLFDDTVSLYHLDQISVDSNAKRDLGPLPKTSILLLTILGLVWVLIIAGYILKFIRARKSDR